MTESIWEKVYLVADRGENGFEVIEAEGFLMMGSDWTVNLRGPSCRAKLLETVPRFAIYRTREGAEDRIRELRKGKRDLEHYGVYGMEAGLRAVVGHCEYCGRPDGVELESSCTAYHWDGEGPNPNRRRQLCRPCAKEHYEYWDDMWRAARGG